MGLRDSTFDRFLEVASRAMILPAWLRPAVWGALLILLIVAARIGGIVAATVITLAAVLSYGAAGWLLVPAAIAVAIAAGAAGGLAYSLLRPLRAVRAGDYPSWIVACAAYFTVLGLALEFPKEGRLATDDLGSILVLALLAAIPFGTYLAHEMGPELRAAGREIEEESNSEPPPSDLVAQARATDLAEVEQWASRSDYWRTQLEAIRRAEPGNAYVQHWRRVRDRLTRFEILSYRQWRAAALARKRYRRESARASSAT